MYEQPIGGSHATVEIFGPSDRNFYRFPPRLLANGDKDGEGETFIGNTLAHIIYDLEPKRIFGLTGFESPGGQIGTTQEVTEVTTLGGNRIPVWHGNGLFLEPGEVVIFETTRGCPLVVAANFASGGDKFAIVFLHVIDTAITAFQALGVPPHDVDFAMPYVSDEDARVFEGKMRERNVRSFKMKNRLSEYPGLNQDGDLFIVVKHNVWYQPAQEERQLVTQATQCGA